MTTAQRHEALTVSIRQLGESMEVARGRFQAATARGDQRAADMANASYRRMLDRQTSLQERLGELETVLCN